MVNKSIRRWNCVYTLILNPISGNGKALRSLDAIERVMKEFALEYRVVRTQEPLNATALAREAAERGDEGIVVIGGDGTVRESLDGIAGSDTALLFAPCGTGNDFVKCIGLPVNAEKALRKQLEKPVRKLDHGTVNGAAFMNVCGAGFDVEVLRKLTSYKEKFQGIKAYLMALKEALREYKPFECEISIDGSEFEHKSLTIMSIGNGQYIGGGMKAVPGGKPNDGLLSVVLVKAVKRRYVALLLPLFITGRHIKLPITTVIAAKSVCVKAKDMTFEMDGELFNIDSADISVVPSGINARY